jgi:hypothetical protein
MSSSKRAPTRPEPLSDVPPLDELAAAYRSRVAEVQRRIVGQRGVLDNLVAKLLAGGHALPLAVTLARWFLTAARLPPLSDYRRAAAIRGRLP